MMAQIQIPDALHRRTGELVKQFAETMAEKLLESQQDFDHWPRVDWESECMEGFLRHVAKGDPVDVANYCAFMWYHQWRTRFTSQHYEQMPLAFELSAA